MSIKSKVLATVATLATVGGVGTAGVLGTEVAATAATSSCGQTCIDIFSDEFGNHASPNYILDVQGQGRIGQPVILYSASDTNPGEDFRLAMDGTVADLYAAHIVTAALALHYGCIPKVNFPDCFGQTKFAVNDPAFEIEYTPGGTYGGLCVGVAGTAVQGEGVTLQECGSSRTVWAVDQYDQPVVNRIPHFIRRHRTQRHERNFYRQIELPPVTDVDDNRIRAPWILGPARQEIRHFLNRLLRRR